MRSSSSRPLHGLWFETMHVRDPTGSSKKTEDHLHLCPYLSYVSGALAGFAATVGSYPFDLLRTVLALQSEPKVDPNMRSTLLDQGRHPRYGARVEPHAYKKNMVDAIQQILRYEGWAGLYKGIVPSTGKAAPASAVTFVAYKYISDWLESIAH
ncbi:hypothetical protein MLD38_017984 [Melastoma candidum]|uniref:Uncharacterized protein n=1 Tax=Melastoma candidum TaxID=119954 RepID=A0ACB9QTQ3_9MYRT|nr:hypothetical protein MLD38_017984 [Melastoma candidum]